MTHETFVNLLNTACGRNGATPAESVTAAERICDVLGYRQTTFRVKPDGCVAYLDVPSRAELVLQRLRAGGENG